MLFADVIVTSEYGTQNLAWRKKDITHKSGWNGLFPHGTIVNIAWENFTQMTNISYDLSAWSLDDSDDYVLIQHTFNQIPDKVGVVEDTPAIWLNESLTGKSNF